MAFFIFDRTYMAITTTIHRHKKNVIRNSPNESNQDAANDIIQHTENDPNQNVEDNAAVTAVAATNTSDV
tara:strand:+ start:2035 stop:2244 length:210 start_codon:yes stop_codon:yes gene_type:complete